MIIADLGSGGAQRVFTDLANHWARAGVRICVVTMSRRDDDFFSLDPTVDRISIGGLAASRNLVDQLHANIGRLLSLRRAMRQARAKCVISFIGTVNILSVMAAVGLGVRLVICERNDPSRQSLGRPWDILRRWLYRRADVVTANSRGALDALRSFVPAAKLAFVPNPLPLPPAGRGADPDARRVLNVARLNQQKAQDVLLKAFAKVYAAGAPCDWQLVIVGEGEERENLVRLSEQLGIKDAVEFAGRVKDPYDYYSEAGLFALPSRHEGTPNALLEAMSIGLPVIVSDGSSGPLDYVVNDETGLVVAVDDVEALAQALARLMTDRALRCRLGEAARHRVNSGDRQAAYSAWQEAVGLDVPMPSSAEAPALSGRGL